jgi:hypothetical protein
MSNTESELLVDDSEADVYDMPEPALMYEGDNTEDVLNIPPAEQTKELPTDLATDNEDVIGELSGRDDSDVPAG